MSKRSDAQLSSASASPSRIGPYRSKDKKIRAPSAAIGAPGKAKPKPSASCPPSFPSKNGELSVPSIPELQRVPPPPFIFHCFGKAFVLPASARRHGLSIAPLAVAESCAVMSYPRLLSYSPDQNHLVFIYSDINTLYP